MTQLERYKLAISKLKTKASAVQKAIAAALKLKNEKDKADARVAAQKLKNEKDKADARAAALNDAQDKAENDRIEAEKLRLAKEVEAEKLRLAKLTADEEARKKAAGDELVQAEANAKRIAAELALKEEEEDAAALAIIVAAEAEAKRKADEEEKKRKAAELAALTEAQRIRNNRISRLLSKGIVVRNGYTLKSFAERMEFLDNERIRRSTEDERRIAIDILIGDEPQTKLEFDEYIANLQSEFDLLMQSKYPWFTRKATTTAKEKEDLNQY